MGWLGRLAALLTALLSCFAANARSQSQLLGAASTAFGAPVAPSVTQLSKAEALVALALTQPARFRRASAPGASLHVGLVGCTLSGMSDQTKCVTQSDPVSTLIPEIARQQALKMTCLCRFLRLREHQQLIKPRKC